MYPVRIERITLFQNKGSGSEPTILVDSKELHLVPSLYG
mgnify:CR=1 FL=1